VVIINFKVIHELFTETMDNKISQRCNTHGPITATQRRNTRQRNRQKDLHKIASLYLTISTKMYIFRLEIEYIKITN
jgi:hypothetical protein